MIHEELRVRVCVCVRACVTYVTSVLTCACIRMYTQHVTQTLPTSNVFQRRFRSHGDSPIAPKASRRRSQRSSRAANFQTQRAPRVLPAAGDVGGRAWWGGGRGIYIYIYIYRVIIDSVDIIIIIIITISCSIIIIIIIIILLSLIIILLSLILIIITIIIILLLLLLTRFIVRGHGRGVDTEFGMRAAGTGTAPSRPVPSRPVPSRPVFSSPVLAWPSLHSGRNFGSEDPSRRCGRSARRRRSRASP